MSVVLPAPFSPSRASISPWCRVREMSSLAVRGPKCLVMPESRSRGVVDMGDRKKGPGCSGPLVNQKVDLGSLSLISMTSLPALMAASVSATLAFTSAAILSSNS